MKQFIFVILAAMPLFGLASDHIDGPVTTEHAISDLADLYFFPSPTKPGHVVMAVNTHFAAYKNNHFNSGIAYQFHLRQVEKDLDNRAFEYSNPKTITCIFDVPKGHNHHDEHHHVTCESDFGFRISGDTEKVIESEGSSLFTGLRSDPFFFNIFWVGGLISKGEIPAPTDSDIMKNLNALSIVLEIDLKKIYPNAETPLVAIAASAHSLKEDNKTLESQLDWVGRPEITNVTMAPRSGADLRDEYNQTISPFSMPDEWTHFHEKIYQNLVFFDAIDDFEDRIEPIAKEFTNLLLNQDALVLDTSLPCHHGANYLNIEKALFAGKDHYSCGGRLLEDDFIDIMINYYIQGSSYRQPIADGVYAPHKSVLNHFPYLNQPEISQKGWWAMKKARALSWLQGLMD